MKTYRILMVAVMVIAGAITGRSQNIDAEVPGDNFSLEGALELFKKSSSPEEFEKLLNSPDQKVNNLDLNGDGYIDYIRVIDRQEGNVHAFILQAVVSDTEYQDVAVIELEKKGNGEAVLQIVGDADVYGIETIIEPTREVRTYAGARTTRTVVNVWTWPVVRHVYAPGYTVWVSPWGWKVRPVWWRPWRPVTYVHYHTIWRPYRPYYSVCHTRRVVYAHSLYRPHRVTSVVVRDRYRPQIERYRNDYRNGRIRDDRRYVEGRRPTRSSQVAGQTRPTTPPATRTRDAGTVQRNLVRTQDQTAQTQPTRRTQVTRRSSEVSLDRSRQSGRESSVNSNRARQMTESNAPSNTQSAAPAPAPETRRETAAPARMQRVETPDRNRPTLNMERTRTAPERQNRRSNVSPSTRGQSPGVASPNRRQSSPDVQRSRSSSPSNRASELRR